MSLPQHVSDPIQSKTPTGAVIVSLLCIASLFAWELASVSALSGWWYDDLFSLWASERTLPFSLVFSERILPDSNPPIYFSLLYFVRQFLSNDGAAVLVTNIGAIIAASVAVYLPSRRLGLSGLAIGGIAAFVLSGPVQYFAPEGRSYVAALSIVFVTSWYVSLAIIGFPEQLSLRRCLILGCLAALTHVYAALFCGGLAAGLLALVVFRQRKDLLKPGLALGLSASIVLSIWLSFSISSATRLDWIEFSMRKVLTAALSVKELALGANIEVIVVVGVFSFGLLNASSRSHFIVFCIAFLIFALLPLVVSLVKPIITSRYWQIGAAALPVLVIFAARTWFLEGFKAPSTKRLIAGVAAISFIVTSSVLGFANARNYISSKPFWVGGDLVRPLLARCKGATVHVYYENLGRPYSPRPWAMWSFHRLTGASPTLFVDAQQDSTPYLNAATSSCSVLGWAEHSWDWQDMDDSEILELLKIKASRDTVDIVRHESGFVILKRTG